MSTGEISSEHVIVIAVAAIAMHGLIASGLQGVPPEAIAADAFDFAQAMVDEAKQRGYT